MLKKPARRNRRSKAYKSLPQNQCPSICRVCGNAATGYHYEVPSCNGCKTFFRKTLIAGGELSCRRSNNCIDGTVSIDLSKRRCRACRFAKCVEVGMNPLAIQVEVKSSKVIVQRQDTMSSLMFIEVNLLNRMIRKLNSIEKQVEQLLKNGVPAGYMDRRNLEEILSSKPCFLPEEIPNLQIVRIEEKSTREDPIQIMTLSPRVDYRHSLFLASVESSKMFDFSSQLELDSKTILMKHVAIVCSHMTDAFFSIHNLRSEVRQRPPDENAVFECNWENIVWTEHERILQKTIMVFLSTKIDTIEYLLFKAIMLCNPAVPGLSVFDQTVIEKERNKYMRALLNYCLLQHGTLNGPARFAAILALAPIIEEQAKRQKDFYVYLKANHFLEEKCVSVMFDQIMEP